MDKKLHKYHFNDTEEQQANRFKKQRLKEEEEALDEDEFSEELYYNIKRFLK
jgi:hypothetical protein